MRPPHDPHLRRVRTVLGYIRDHADEDLSLAALAQRAGCSRQHFHRLFVHLTGTTLHRHVRGLRLQQAALALRSTDTPVVRIALDAGFATHEGFTRAFRAVFGTSPTAYRAQRGVRRSRQRAPTRVRSPRQPRTAAPAPELRISLVKVPVTDFARARAFYRDALGMEEECAVEAYGWASYRTGSVPLALYVTGQGGGDAVPGGELPFHLEVADAQALCARLQAQGVPLACPLTRSDDGGAFFMPRDPDGNTFKILTFATS